MNDNGEQNEAPAREDSQEQPPVKQPPAVSTAKQQHQKAILAYFERTRNDNGERMTSNNVEMKSKLSLVVTLDGVYSAPRYDMVIKDKGNRSKFYPSQNDRTAGRQNSPPPALLKNHIAQWQNNMEAAEGRGSVATPKHTLQIREQQKRRRSGQSQSRKAPAIEVGKDKDNEREN